MTDGTMTAPPAPVLNTTPDPAPTSAPSSFADALKMMKEKESWDTGEPQIGNTTPEDVDAALDAAPAEPAPETAQPDPLQGFQLDAEGRLHRPDGTFANAEEIGAWNAGATPAPSAEAAQQPAEQAQPIVVEIRGRDGNTVEIEVDDEQAAEALRTNHREGLRAAEYKERMAEVEAKEQQYRAFETMLETNPEYVILQHLPLEKQISLATALVAQHWDRIAGKLVEFDQQPTSRLNEVISARDRIDAQKGDYASKTEAANYGRQVQSQVSALVPSGTPDDVAERFLMDASRDIADAIAKNGNRPVAIDAIKGIVQPRLALYGLDRPNTATTLASANKANAPKRPLAKPVSAATPTTQTPKASDVSATIRRAVTAQRIAAAVPPQGAGAATVRTPLVPSTASISEASQALRKQGSWSRPA